MTEEMSLQESMEQRASFVIKTLKSKNAPADYSIEALRCLENDLGKNRIGLSEEAIDNLTTILGAFFGECLRRNYGGTWIEMDEGLAVHFEKDNITAFPFAKVYKFLANGDTDSFVSMYEMLPLIKGNKRGSNTKTP
jgi:hypothetical protein